MILVQPLYIYNEWCLTEKIKLFHCKTLAAEIIGMPFLLIVGIKK